MYSVFMYFGYFLPMIVLMGLAVFLARKTSGWIPLIAGAVIELLSLIGNQRRYNFFGLGDMMITYWIIYVVLLMIFAVAFFFRRYYLVNTGSMSRKAAKASRKNAEAEGTVFCPECGGSVKSTELFCPKCNRKM